MTPELEREFEAACNEVYYSAAPVDVSLQQHMRPLFERLAADAERLNWIVKQTTVAISRTEDGAVVIAEDGRAYMARETGTLREAIDKAREGK